MPINSRYLMLPFLAALPVFTSLHATTTFTDLDGDNLLDINELADFEHLKTLEAVKIEYNDLQDLTGINQLTNADGIHLRHNKITSLDSSDFPLGTNIHGLTISDNAIPKIKANTFANLKNLGSLSLYSNTINQIEDGAFTGLNELHNLQLSNNQISTLNQNTFGSMPKLVLLHLDYNQLTDNSIHQDTFSNMPYLNVLILSSNQFTRINAEYLPRNNNFKTLVFGNNQLTTFTVSQIENLANLEDLYLYGNPITSIDNANYNKLLPQLKRLDLSAAKLSTLTAQSFKNFPSLKDLTLKYIPTLTQVDNDALSHLTHLQELDFDGCTNFKPNDNLFNTITTLKTLRLANTNITTITPNTLKNLNNLQTLDLSRCNEITIQENAFSDVTSIQKLWFLNTDVNTLNFEDASFRNLTSFQCPSNLQVANLTNLDISKDAFSSLFSGGIPGYDSNIPLGLATSTTLHTIIFDGVDFDNNSIDTLTDLFTPQLSASLTTLSFVNANINDSGLLEIIDTSNLVNLNTINLTGTWNRLSPQTQQSFTNWSKIASHTLIIPEPATLSLLSLTALLALTPRRRSA